MMKGFAAGILAVVLCGCAGHEATETTEAKVDFGAGDSYRPAACALFAVKVGESDYVIFKATTAADVPSEGATVTSTTFDGFGQAIIHNESDNTDIQANIVYHADTYDAILTKLKTLECFP